MKRVDAMTGTEVPMMREVTAFLYYGINFARG